MDSRATRALDYCRQRNAKTFRLISDQFCGSVIVIDAVQYVCGSASEQ